MDKNKSWESAYDELFAPVPWTTIVAFWVACVALGVIAGALVVGWATFAAAAFR